VTQRELEFDQNYTFDANPGFRGIPVYENGIGFGGDAEPGFDGDLGGGDVI